jgi:hypothetical protein
MKKLILGVVFCFGLLSLSGCSGPVEDSIKVDFNASSALKKELEGFAQSGVRLGSGTNSLRALARELQKDDPSKGDAVLKAIDELSELKDGPKIKQKANEILKLL